MNAVSIAHADAICGDRIAVVKEWDYFKSGESKHLDTGAKIQR